MINIFRTKILAFHSFIAFSLINLICFYRNMFLEKKILKRAIKNAYHTILIHENDIIPIFSYDFFPFLFMTRKLQKIQIEKKMCLNNL